MTSPKQAPWRIRFILLALGVTIGLLAKWFAGHYESPKEGAPAKEDTPRRKIVRADQIRRLFPASVRHFSLHPPDRQSNRG